MSVGKWLRDRKLSWAKHSLEGELSRIIEVMNGHKEASLPTGHKYYKRLWDKASTAIGDFATKYQVAGDDIYVSLPALQELELLASGEPSGSTPETVGRIVGLSLLGSFVVTTVFALNHNLYLALTYWFSAHWSVR